MALFSTTFGLLGFLASFFPNSTLFFNLTSSQNKCGSYLYSSTWKFLTFLEGRDLSYLLFIVFHFYFLIFILTCRIHVTMFVLTSEKAQGDAYIKMLWIPGAYYIYIVCNTYCIFLGGDVFCFDELLLLLFFHLFLNLVLFFGLFLGFWRWMCIFLSVIG